MGEIRPILFNTDMVRAILDGRKMVTRRVVKGEIKLNLQAEHKVCFLPYKIRKDSGTKIHSIKYYTLESFVQHEAPYKTGDFLYVRETWREHSLGFPQLYIYKADYSFCKVKWKPNIHMPKEAARIWLKITDVRVERLQDINGGGCIAEGVEPEALEISGEFAKGIFHGIWDSTIKKTDLPRYGWDANPWVWMIEFKRCEKPGKVNEVK